MKALIRLLADLDPIFLFDPRKRDVSAIGDYALTYNGGLSKVPVDLAEISGGGKALSLDGTDDYVSTTFGTRRNLCTNPRAAVDVSGWTNSSLTTFERVTSLPTTSGLPGGMTGSAFHGVGDASGDRMQFTLPVTSGQSYTVSAYIRLASLSATDLRWIVYRADASTIVSTASITAVGGGFARYSLTFVAAATENHYVQVRQSGAGACEFHALGFLFEQSSGLAAYFDGTGYVNASGTWVAATDTFRTDLSGMAWTGTAHASTSTYAGRTNLCRNPSFETGTSEWDTPSSWFVNLGATISQDTTAARWGSASLKVINPGAAVYEGTRMANIPVTSGTTYTATGWVKGTAGKTVSINLGASGVGTATGSVTLGSSDWTRISVSLTASGTGNAQLAFVGPNSLSAQTFYVDGVMVEASSSVNAYFDGSGVVEHQGLTGWLGLEHASASDKGVFANGTTRTFVGVAQPSSDAASGVVQTLVGSNLAGATTTAAYLYNNAGTRQFRLAVNGTLYSWNLTAAEISATAAGQTFMYRVEFNETADTAALQINALPVVTKSSVKAQHVVGQTAAQIGAYSTGLSPFPGKLGPVAIFSRALTADEHRAIAKTTLAGMFG